MKCKVQFVKQSASTIISAPPQELYSDTITIGRATTQDIFLSDSGIALEHARIRIKSAEQVYIETARATGIEINGHLETKAKLELWDKIVLGGYIISVVPAEGYDLSLLVEEQKKAAAPEKTAIATDVPVVASEQEPAKEMPRLQRLAMNLSETRLSKRRWSWSVFIFVICVFLLLPLTFSLMGKPNAMLAAFLPGDRFWSAGRISHVHRYFGSSCNTCHRKPFVRVENEVCINCHRDTTAHTHMDKMPANMTLVENGRCGHCHQEHNDTLSLKPGHQNLCVGCHGTLSGQAGVQTLLLNVSDFGADHPQFRPTVFATGAWLRMPIGHPQLQHNTGLKFSHAVHLKSEGVDSPQGQRVLECADCHHPEPGGAYMLPVNMERDCQSCHQLNFDPAVPERTLPHGDLAQLSLFLNEFYALQALQGGYTSADAPDSIKRRRRPNERVSKREQRDALQWARRTALKITREVVETRICISCHTITTASGDAAGWSIEPVHQPLRWFPLSRFNHAKHDSSACTDCHAARNSDNSNDVLLPGIENCRKCHGGARAEDKYASTCIVCHQFHLSGKPAYGLHTDTHADLNRELHE